MSITEINTKNLSQARVIADRVSLWKISRKKANELLAKLNLLI